LRAKYVFLSNQWLSATLRLRAEVFVTIYRQSTHCNPDIFEKSIQ